MIMAMVVVLPAPLPPSSPVTDPAAIRKETPSTARERGYCLTTFSRSMAGAAACMGVFIQEAAERCHPGPPAGTGSGAVREFDDKARNLLHLHHDRFSCRYPPGP